MKWAGALLAVLLLAGCASLQRQACPAGHERLRTAQLFLGRSAGDRPVASEAAFRKFVDEELATRFPDGLTVLDGGGQWKGKENKPIREASKVVLIVLPGGKGEAARLEAASQAYKARFKQDAVMLITQPACVPY